MKDIKLDIRDQEFSESYCPKEGETKCAYRYNIEIKDWKLPLIDLIFQQDNNQESSDMAGGGIFSPQIYEVT